MNVLEALKTRKSVRAYLPKPVSQSTIETLLDAARCAPSGTNTQPWQVYAVMGDKKQHLQATLLDAFYNGHEEPLEYHYYPQVWKEPYKSRRRACGLQLYSTMDVKREDTEKRMELWAQNYSGFGAPVILFFFMEKILEKGSFLDYGMFLQSVMLAAVDLGLATCPQAAYCNYASIVKKALQVDDEFLLVCGMALGYEDTEATINSYRTPREPVASVLHFP